MYSEKKFINLKKITLKQNNYYSFVYNNNYYYGKFIERKNILTLPPQTIFIFNDFVIQNHVYQPLNILCFNESDIFSDNESDCDSPYKETT